MTVPARISLVTLGVADVAAATAFYQALGWPLSSASVPGDVSFFNTAGGVLALWGDEDLRADVGEPSDPLAAGLTPSVFRGFTLAINLGGEQEVDDAMAAVTAAGGRVVKPPHRTGWGGYSGYFADPDGNIFEVAHNPFWPLDDDGLPTLP